MASEVYFLTSRSVGNRSVLEALSQLVEAAGLGFIEPRQLVAVKVHVGHPGTTRFLRPQFVKVDVEAIKRRGARPFLTDSNTLYRGERDNAVDHAVAAAEHGFDFFGPERPSSWRTASPRRNPSRWLCR